MKGLCDEIHSMGLKVGIYSTPWVTSYARFSAARAENPEGPGTLGQRTEQEDPAWAIGKYSFAEQDAKQWAAWGFDYLKYDWKPERRCPHVERNGQGTARQRPRHRLQPVEQRPVRAGRATVALANCWRTTGDIRDNWDSRMSPRSASARTSGPLRRARPLERSRHARRRLRRLGHRSCIRRNLTPDEQYTHISLWCLLPSPLLIGCDLEQLDDFTLGLLDQRRSAGGQPGSARQAGDARVSRRAGDYDRAAGSIRPAGAGAQAHGQAGVGTGPGGRLTGGGAI